MAPNPTRHFRPTRVFWTRVDTNLRKSVRLDEDRAERAEHAVMSSDRKSSRLGLSTSEAARHLGVSLSTIRRWSDAGHLQGYRTPGGQRRFTVEQLDQFLESLEQRTRTPSPSANGR